MITTMPLKTKTACTTVNTAPEKTDQRAWLDPQKGQQDANDYQRRNRSRVAERTMIRIQPGPIR